MFQSLVHGLRHTLRIPSQCAVCDTWPATGLVCQNCVGKYAKLVARCRTCALALPAPNLAQCGACMVNTPPLDACYAAVSYTHPWIECIARYKFGSDPAWSKIFSQLLQDNAHIKTAIADADLVLPIPLSFERLRERGYNQAHELSKRLTASRLTASKSDPHLLLRIKHTDVQSRLKRSERQKNVASAFALNPLRSADVKGKRVVLVDDVMTSGATLYAAAKVLRLAQANHITAVVFARTEIQ